MATLAKFGLNLSQIQKSAMKLINERIANWLTEVELAWMNDCCWRNEIKLNIQFVSISGNQTKQERKKWMKQAIAEWITNRQINNSINLLKNKVKPAGNPQSN